ncbi:MAG: substrate-binding domain-containing protein [Clostridiales Family XIII bacterium]|jgi:ABC-type sugar transport system substrate-binding protein|nr:substrate-binding domain-containing protein [Clostridiales Family XIII bacterium]
MKDKSGASIDIPVLAAVLLLVALLACACDNTAAAKERDEDDVNRKVIGFYADEEDPYYRQINDVIARASAEDPDTNWEIDFRVGKGTAEGQLKAVEDFITKGHDAVVAIQNNPDTTGECIAKCKAAGIPYFGAVYDFYAVPNAKDSAGSTAYDFVYGGYLAGLDALNRGVQRVVNIEGASRQGTDTARTLGFLKAYEDAGMSLGGYTAEQIAAEKPPVSRLDGTQAVEIVFWASGSRIDDSAGQAMKDAISLLGKNGFDAVFIHNDSMAEDVIKVMAAAGLASDRYWIGAIDGWEMSWNWAEDGKITMDVNQPATLEGILLYQQLKAYFNGEAYRAHLRPYFTPYTKDDIRKQWPTLVPTTDINAFMQGYKDGAFATDINDPKFTDIEAYR